MLWSAKDGRFRRLTAPNAPQTGVTALRHQPHNRHARRGQNKANFNQRVPVSVDGTTQMIPAGAIAQDNWHKAHGTALDGTSVHSAEFAQFGDSTLIRGDGGHVLSMPTPDAEILAVTLAGHFGYKVTPKKNIK
jgi:hypothetical protein